jgi:MFS transporter, CP family, cyanate transporter
LESQTQTVTNVKNVPLTRVLLLVGILFVAFNLRPAITAVGPLISVIREDLNISNGVAGIITTLPLLSFAILSFIAPKLAYRFGNETMVFLGLFVLFIGIIIRSSSLLLLLLTGTFLIGVGIAIGNVLLPSIVKNRYPEKVGLITGTYTTCMNVFAALGSGVSIPLAVNLKLGWKNSLLFWAVLALVALMIWIPQIKHREQDQNKKALNLVNNIWKSKIAWQVTIFMGLQSFLFYSTIAWLPEILSSNGLHISVAGWMVSIMQVVGLPMAFLTPVIADRLKNQRSIVMLIGGLYVLGTSGLLLNISLTSTTISIILIGFAQGSSISLSLTLLSLRSSTAQQAAQLSGMAQSIGYALAAIGPTMIGILFDLTKTWDITLLLLLSVIIIMTVFGLGAGREMKVFENQS